MQQLAVNVMLVTCSTLNVLSIFLAFTDSLAEDVTGNMMREKGSDHSKGTQACCSEDKASAHGTPALPTQLNGTQLLTS